MRKLDLTSYQAKAQAPGGDPAKPIIDIVVPYPAKDTILGIMFIPALRLNGVALAKQNVLALKIEECQEDFIILEEEEFERIRTAFDTHVGWIRMDLELVERIKNTPRID